MSSTAVLVVVVGNHKALVAAGIRKAIVAVGIDTGHIVEEAALAAEQANPIEFHNCHKN